MDTKIKNRNTNNSSDNLYKKINDINREKRKEEEKNNVKKRTQNIIIICLILIFIGFANFYSAILRFESNIVFNKILKHLLIFSLSVACFLISSKINFKIFKARRIRYGFLVLGIFTFLIVAYFPNKDIFPIINGGKGWLRIKGFSLQITEIFKIAYIIMISSLLARGKDDDSEIQVGKNAVSIIIYATIFGFLLTFSLKDLGTAIHYIIITIFLLFLSDLKDKLVWTLVGFGFIFLSSATFLFYKFGESFGYKHHRLKIFVDGILENTYDRVEAYQIYQSLVGFGTGGLFGKGYGNGVQKYSYIPEVETDFAISTFGEEMGLLGMILILITFFILFILIMNVAENSKSYFGKYLAAAIGGYFITQTIINIGVAIGLIPVLGIPLPFISSGGSSLLALSIAMGLVININNSKLKDLEG
ncbi:FtsW/RodA/SpoVE family cell cycle protein [Fusobacterium russii]|uniref:FtsW/RodA/SpoVE family cell cycle protein n=1 Tax=Fusobacterium russii TaxID=854 RepID=UPI0003A7CDED|nr:FtsW/RodA/SpoVE family cell cycle protein [Fusobacterium russii]